MPLHKRLCREHLTSLIRRFPAVAILGARQIGKSTLARSALPDFDYLDLENPSDRQRLENDPFLTLEQSRKTIIDEAQLLLRDSLESSLLDHFRSQGLAKAIS